jgi:hypothetical protein
MHAHDAFQGSALFSTATKRAVTHTVREPAPVLQTLCQLVSDVLFGVFTLNGRRVPFNWSDAQHERNKAVYRNVSEPAAGSNTISTYLSYVYIMFG